MDYKPNLIGTVVEHKLLGRVIITKTPNPELIKHNGLWEVRNTEGHILLVDQRELEPLSDGTKLRELALATMRLAEIALKEADLLDQKGGK
jgi:hypothetical protein